MKRTQEEILKRIEERKDADIFGFETTDYIMALDFEHAKPFLKKGAKEEEWTPTIDPVEEIKNYMEFAWDKANNMRGNSAWRTLCHMTAWLWLAGEDKFLEDHNNFEKYEFYGKPHLIDICEKYGIDWKQYDDGVRSNGGDY